MTSAVKSKSKTADRLVRTRIKVAVPDALVPALESLRAQAKVAMRLMLENPALAIPSDLIPQSVADGLVAKYQRKGSFKQHLARWYISIQGDSGKNIQIAKGCSGSPYPSLSLEGIRVPDVFKKKVIPVDFPAPPVSYIQEVSFFKQWGYASKEGDFPKGTWCAAIYYMRHPKKKTVTQNSPAFISAMAALRGTEIAKQRAIKGGEAMWENKEPEPVPFDPVTDKWLLATLDEREREVLFARYGIKRERKTLAEIAEIFGMTRQRIHQLQRGALAKIENGRKVTQKTGARKV